MTMDSLKMRQEAETGKRRIAFFGGTFDPPHAGHLGIARAALEALELDKVLFAPVGVQPLKIGGRVSASLGSAVATFEERLEMTRLAIQDETGFKISKLDAPVRGNVPNFTAETLERLKAESDPESEIFCLMGADSFLQLSRWHRASELPFLAGLIVAARPGEELEPMAQHLPPGVELVSGPLISDDDSLKEWKVYDLHGRQAIITVLPNLHYEISATELRAAIQSGEQNLLNGEKLLKPAVLDYIIAHKLYQ
jgi:nicotinate-nucleotide adenylyltransferase